VQPPAHLSGPGLQSLFLKPAVPMRRDGKLRVHERRLTGTRPMANLKRNLSRQLKTND
jgi:hypothetical protein